MARYDRRYRLDEFVTVEGVKEDDGMQQPNAQGQGMQQQPPAQPEGQQQPPMGGQMPDMGMGDPNAMPQDGGMDMGDQNGQMPDMGMGDPNAMPQDGGMDMGQPMDVTQGMGLPDADMGQDGIEDINMDDPNAAQPGDEVIDIDDLTQSQQSAEYKIDGVDDKLTTLGAVVNKFIEALKQNDKKIDDLKAEFEKRNPTAEERLNLRSMSSVPYMETPREYWDHKASGDPRYNIMHDNTIAPKDEQDAFELKRGDINGSTDREVADSFDYPLSLNDVLDF